MMHHYLSERPNILLRAFFMHLQYYGKSKEDVGMTTEASKQTGLCLQSMLTHWFVELL